MKQLIQTITDLGSKGKKLEIKTFLKSEPE